MSSIVSLDVLLISPMESVWRAGIDCRIRQNVRNGIRLLKWLLPIRSVVSRGSVLMRVDWIGGTTSKPLHVLTTSRVRRGHVVSVVTIVSIEMLHEQGSPRSHISQYVFPASILVTLLATPSIFRRFSTAVFPADELQHRCSCKIGWATTLHH